MTLTRNVSFEVALFVDFPRRGVGDQPRASDQRERRPRNRKVGGLCPERALEGLATFQCPFRARSDMPVFLGRRSRWSLALGWFPRPFQGEDENSATSKLTLRVGVRRSYFVQRRFETSQKCLDVRFGVVAVNGHAQATDRKSTRLNSSHRIASRMPSSA